MVLLEKCFRFVYTTRNDFVLSLANTVLVARISLGCAHNYNLQGFLPTVQQNVCMKFCYISITTLVTWSIMWFVVVVAWVLCFETCVYHHTKNMEACH
jgi:hypothetical protein